MSILEPVAESERALGGNFGGALLFLVRFRGRRDNQLKLANDFGNILGSGNDYVSTGWQLIMKNLTRFQILAFLPLLVLVAGGSYFHHLVMYAINTNFAMNAIILGVMLIGVVIMHRLIWSIRRQSRMADEFVTRIRLGEQMRVVLQDPEMGSADIGLVCDHLVHSHDGVSGNPVDVVEAGLRSLHVTLDSRQELAQFLIGFLVALGLMGTFLGILETLVEIGNMIGGFATADMQNIDKAFMALISDLTKPLQGMGTAFSASMFGLLGSLCLGLTMIAVRRCTEEFLTSLRHAINQLIKDRRSGAAKAEGAPSRRGDDSAEQQRVDENMFQQGLEAQARVMQKLDTLDQRLSELSAAMLKQVEGAAETNDLLRASSVPKQTTEQFMGQVKVLALTATENSTSLASLLPALSAVTQKLNAFSDVLLQQREHIQQTMLSSTESQGMIRSALTSMVDGENEIHRGMLNEITQLRKFMFEMQPVSTQMLPLLNEINSRLNEQSIASSNQQESMRLMTQAITQTFGGLKTGIGEMLRDAEMSRQLQSEISSQLTNSQRAAAELGNLQQSLAKIAEVIANSATASKVLVEEVKSMRESVKRDVRYEMQEVLRKHEVERGGGTDKDNDPGKARS
jgi:Mg2+ and Co2+ transporter CorA